MNNTFRRMKKPAAFVVGLALVGAVATVAPATASAQEAGKASTSSVRTVSAPAPKQAHDWNW